MNDLWTPPIKPVSEMSDAEWSAELDRIRRMSVARHVVQRRDAHTEAVLGNMKRDGFTPAQPPEPTEPQPFIFDAATAEWLRRNFPDHQKFYLNKEGQDTNGTN